MMHKIHRICSDKGAIFELFSHTLSFSLLVKLPEERMGEKLSPKEREKRRGMQAKHPAENLPLLKLKV